MYGYITMDRAVFFNCSNFLPTNPTIKATPNINYVIQTKDIGYGSSMLPPSTVL